MSEEIGAILHTIMVIVFLIFFCYVMAELFDTNLKKP